MAVLQPDRYFSRISHIDVAHDLRERGLDTVLLDIDNTLRSRADGRVPADAQAWLDRCAEAGIRVCLFSNNWHENVITSDAKPDGYPALRARIRREAGGWLSVLPGAEAVIGDDL